MGDILVLPIRFRLHELLEARPDVSQAELARRAGLSNTTINEIALNKTKRISLATIEAICAALGVTPGDLFELETDRPRRRKSA